MRFLLALLLASVALAQDAAPKRFLVELVGTPAIKAQNIGARRAAIRREQTTVEAALTARRLLVVARVNTVANVLVVQADDALQLGGIPGIRRVEPVVRFEPLLIKALPLHRVPQAWDATGGIANAGKGIKIGILDTGIDMTHPGFAAGDMTAPDGFPQANSDDNLALTNGKVIVARSFDGWPVTDIEGHGTGVAMAAAGVQHESPLGTISGVAPAAWLGVYRVSDLNDFGIYSDIVLQALDWVVQDGMDVINMSFGAVGRFGASGTIYGDAVRNVVDQGIVVVRAAGNTAGPMTVDDTASQERVIAVGSNNSPGSDTTEVAPSVGPTLDGAPSSQVTQHEPISGPMLDITIFDPTGWACDPALFPAESLKGIIPLIERGECDFETKLANVRAAGAPAAVVYNIDDPEYGDPEDLISMIVDNPDEIPGVFLKRSDGLQLKDAIAQNEDFQVVLRFPYSPDAPITISSFSSQGPSVELLIKPDLVATGAPIYTAAVKQDYDEKRCPVCDPSGYISTQGTSFSAPLVAGAAAILKGAHPGLSVDDYRSLLIDSASPFVLSDGATAAVNSAGAGWLNVKNAVTSTIAASPVSLSFGSGGGTIDLTKEVTLKNLGETAATYALTLESANSIQPGLSTHQLTVEPGATATFQVALTDGAAEPGAYQGFIVATDTETGVRARIPYWYAVEDSRASSMIILDMVPYTPPVPNGTDWIFLRVHDAAGLAMSTTPPVVVPVTGGGAVAQISSGADTYPGSWLIQLTMGPNPGINTFRLEVGDFSRTFAILVPAP